MGRSRSQSRFRFGFDPSAPLLVVFATVEGRQPGWRRRLKVALDTGATYTMILELE